MKVSKSNMMEIDSYSLDAGQVIDYKGVLNEAVRVFSDQALITKNSDNVTLKDLQLAKGKAENYLSAVAGLIEISHKVELLTAEKDKFKRVDELRLLNNLRNQFEKAASFSDKLMDMCMSQLESLESELMTNTKDVTGIILKISAVQEFMSNAIVALTNINNGTSKLIKIERESGGRSSSDVKTSNTSINTFLDRDEKDNVPKVKPRKISEKELRESLKGNRILNIDEDEF